MAVKSLAIKYRPQAFSEVCEQSAIKTILTQQLETNSTKNAYLFCGGAGTGKTTCARIFAQEINKGQGNPIEMDAASNSSVDDVREIIRQAKTKSIESEYKCFVVDECHSLSNTAWQAFLKILEEPPAKSIFIFCTTDPQKIPKTIISRVQRYQFNRISQKSIESRLVYVLQEENKTGCEYQWDEKSIEYIAKLADGGMRDALTMMDKCLAYSPNLFIDNVVKALGAADYDTMFKLTDHMFNNDGKSIISTIEKIHMAGLDLKQFIKQYTNFILDLNKYHVTESFDYISIPATKEYVEEIESYGEYEFNRCLDILNTLVKLNADIKWETSPKAAIEATLLLECEVKSSE